MGQLKVLVAQLRQAKDKSPGVRTVSIYTLEVYRYYCFINGKLVCCEESSGFGEEGLAGQEECCYYAGK